MWRRRSSCPARSPSCSPRTSSSPGGGPLPRSMRSGGRTRVGPPWPGSAAVLILVVGIPHLVAANAILAAQGFLDETFAVADPTSGPGTAVVETPVPEFTEPPEETESPPGLTPSPSSSASPSPTPSPTPEIAPYPTDGGNGTLPAFGAAVPWKRADPEKPWGDDGRFDLLLIGSDAGSGRWSRRTDVMLLVEVDVETGKVAMVGMPRNLQNAPYPPGPARDASACGCQPGLINEMYVEATGRHPGLWPGKGAVKGIGAVRSVVSTLTGRPIDAVLIVDLVGVIRVVDAMGGVDIDVPEAVVDDSYPDPGPRQDQAPDQGRRAALRRTRGACLRPDPPHGQRLRPHGTPADPAAGHPQAARAGRDPQRARPVRGRQGHGLDGPAARGPAGARRAVRQDRRRQGQAAADRPAELSVLDDRSVGQPDPPGRRRPAAGHPGPAQDQGSAAGRHPAADAEADAEAHARGRPRAPTAPPPTTAPPTEPPPPSRPRHPRPSRRPRRDGRPALARHRPMSARSPMRGRAAVRLRSRHQRTACRRGSS